MKIPTANQSPLTEKREMTATTKRNYWVDYAKAIGIILVVYGHVARGVVKSGLPMDNYWFTLVDSVIYSFHMPLFFFLSGLFFYESLLRRGCSGLIANKLETIIYPFVIWSLLQGAIELLLSKHTNGGVTTSEVLSFVWNPRAQFWFLHVLFVIFVASSIIYKKIKIQHTKYLLLLFLTLSTFKNELSANSVTLLTLGNSPFFIMGVYFNEIKDRFYSSRKTLTPILGILFLSGQYIFHISLELNYSSDGLPAVTLALISILFISALSMQISNLEIKLLLTIGTSSMIIYLMHIIFGSGTRIILSKVAGITSVYAHLIIGTTSGIILPLIASHLIRRSWLNFLITPPRTQKHTN